MKKTSIIPDHVSIIHNIVFPMALRPNKGHGLLILEVSRKHTMMHQTQ